MRFLADENLQSQILVGLAKHFPNLDIVRAQDVGLGGRPDDELLAWAAAEKRLLLTHDIKTMPDFFYARMAENKPVSGGFLIPNQLNFGTVIDELIFIIECCEQHEWEEKLAKMPLWP